jgi:hypothetical protein
MNRLKTLLQNRWLRWFWVRIVTPVGWFASATFVTRPQLDDPQLEFMLGAAVLLVYAVAVDWPGHPKSKAT